jgi:H+/Cl- antiporter ClcA
LKNKKKHRLAVLFCSVTNCPLATMFIAIEMFGASPVLYIAVGCFTSFLLSGYTSLYSTQKFIFSKFEEKEIKE